MPAVIIPSSHSEVPRISMRAAQISSRGKLRLSDLWRGRQVGVLKGRVFSHRVKNPHMALVIAALFFLGTLLSPEESNPVDVACHQNVVTDEGGVNHGFIRRGFKQDIPGIHERWAAREMIVNLRR